MTRKNTTIRQGIVTEMMEALANLPKREKLPGDLLTLPEIFQDKGYVTEIKGALKRGYSFDDLSEIFTERCGVAVGRHNHVRLAMPRPQRRRAQSRDGW